jgi:type III secretion protein Q
MASDDAAIKAQELDLPTVQLDSVALFNDFYRRREPLIVQLGGHEFTIEASWSAEVDKTSCIAVQLKVDGEQGELIVPSTLVDLVMSGIAGAPALVSLPSEHAALVLEFALNEPLQALEAQFGCQISITSVSTEVQVDEDPMRLPLSFALTIDGSRTASSELRLVRNQAKRLTTQLDQIAGAVFAKPNLLIPASLVIGSVALTADEIADLAPGDVVLADHICSPSTAILVIADHLGAFVTLAADSVRLSDEPVPLRSSGWEWAISRRAQAAPNDTIPAVAIGDIPIWLMFELSRKELPFHQLENLSADEVLPFKLAAGAAVDIVADRKLIGKGEIVDVGVARGVRITRIF